MTEKKEEFLDLLTDIDDSIIEDAAFIVQPKKKIIPFRNIITTAAALFFFVISALLLHNRLNTGSINIFSPSESIPEASDFSAEETTVKTEEALTHFYETTDTVTEQTNTQHTEPFIPPLTLPPEPSSEEPATNESTSSYEPSTEQISSEEPSEEVSASEESTSDVIDVVPPYFETTSEEETSDPNLSVPPPIFDPSCGVTPPDGPEPFFLDVHSSLIADNNETSAPEDKYIFTEEVSWSDLCDIYGTKIIPSKLPVNGLTTDSGILNSIPENELSGDKYKVYTDEEKTDIYSLQTFNFILNDGSYFTVKVSTHEIPLLEGEKKNIGSKSLINDIPVLLISGTSFLGKNILSAYFEKDGCYFRVQIKGEYLSRESFIDSLTTLLQ